MQEQASRFKALSTTLKDPQHSEMEEKGNQIAVLKSSIGYDEDKLDIAIRTIYGEKAREFRNQMEKYEKSPGTIQDKKQAMKDFIGIKPEELGTKEAAKNISDGPYNINAAYDKQSSALKSKEALNQFYGSVMVKTTAFFDQTSKADKKPFLKKEYNEWQQSVGVETKKTGVQAAVKETLSAAGKAVGKFSAKIIKEREKIIGGKKEKENPSR